MKTEKGSDEKKELENMVGEMMAEANLLGAKARELHNKANHLRKDNALKKRLTPLHYQLINELSNQDLVEFRIEEGYYLVARRESESHKFWLELVPENKEGKIEGILLRGEGGFDISIAKLVGPYIAFETLETSSRNTSRDFIYMAPATSHEGKIEGLIKVPLESIVGYKIICKSEESKNLRVYLGDIENFGKMASIKISLP